MGRILGLVQAPTLRLNQSTVYIFALTRMGFYMTKAWHGVFQSKKWLARYIRSNTRTNYASRNFSTLKQVWLIGVRVRVCLYRTLFYRLINGFDDDFFLYCEDVDLSWRVVPQVISATLKADAFFFHYAMDRQSRESEIWRCNFFLFINGVLKIPRNSNENVASTCRYEKTIY